MNHSASILFYSNFCNHSKQIIAEANNSHKKNNIKFICIDSEAVRRKIPKNITSVPTLIESKTNRIIIGSHIIEWLQQRPNHQIQPSHKQHAQNREEETNIQGYQNCEMGMFSDNYSFLNADTSTKGNGGNSIMHNFERLGGDTFQNSNGHMSNPPGAPSAPSAPTTYGAPMTGDSQYGTLQNKESSDFMDKKMQEFLLSRELDVPNTPARI